MTPNLFLATQTLFSPHKWFKNQTAERPTRKTEHWDSPVPGIYEYIPGRGWYLIATDKEVPADVEPNPETTEGGRVAPLGKATATETIRMVQPVAVKYSKVLKRCLLAPDYEMRKRYGKIEDSRGKYTQVGFFRLDDGIAWVQCWDEHGEFIPGPYKLWCIDARTNNFRHMLKGDDPEYIHSRTNSFEREPGARRPSQDSRSTQFRSGPGTPRDGASVPSTRANSIRGLTPSNPTSHPGSQANSRRNSPKRSPTIHLEEAKAALRTMAQEQAAAARSCVDSAATIRRGRLGEPATRVN